MDSGRAVPHGPANVDIGLAGEAGFDAALHAHFGGAPLPCLARPPPDLLERKRVGLAAQVLAHLALRERAKLALEVAHIRVVDVAGDDIGDDVATGLAPQRVGSCAYGGELVAASPKQARDLGLFQPSPGHGPLDDRRERADTEQWSSR